MQTPSDDNNQVSILSKPKRSYLNDEVKELYDQIKTLQKKKIFIHKSVQESIENFGKDLLTGLLDNLYKTKKTLTYFN